MEKLSDDLPNGYSNSPGRFKLSPAKESSTSPKSIGTNLIDDTENEEDIEQDSTRLLELNNRIKNDFMSYCMSFFHDDQAGRQCVYAVWNKYLQCVGDAAMLASFFDALPLTIKTLVLPKYQNEVLEWVRDFFCIQCDGLFYCNTPLETLLQVIRYAMKFISEETKLKMKRAIIYVSDDFDRNLKTNLLSSLTNIQLKICRNNRAGNHTMDINQLEELIERDSNQSDVYPMMVIAQAGASMTGYCDELNKIKKLCDQHDLWLHVTGDLLGSFAVLSNLKNEVKVSCDSFTLDLPKLLAIPNLPLLTIYSNPVIDSQIVKSVVSTTETDEAKDQDPSSTASIKGSTSASLPSSASSSSSSSSSTNDSDTSNEPVPVDEMLVHAPSINMLSIWAMSQRCSKDNLIYHMERSFELVKSFYTGLKAMKTIHIFIDQDQKASMDYQSLCESNAPRGNLPETVLVFRFETLDVPQVEDLEDPISYVDLLNLWLFDKLCHQHPKMNFEILKSAEFQMLNVGKSMPTDAPAHALRFAPLEHLMDTIDETELQSTLRDIQAFSDILLATMAARAALPSTAAKYGNLISIPMPHWAGVGAVRYVPEQTSSETTTERRYSASYDANTIQAELARKLQANDSAFSLGGGSEGDHPSFYLRLGMIRKREDLDVLLEKIALAGKETESSLKYVQDMAEKIKSGIDQAQKDLQEESRQLLAQEGILRQLPVVSSFMSWWSPPATNSPLSTKGRSFDLNSGRVESTEDTYVYRMQIKKQSPHAPTHNDEHATTSVAQVSTISTPPPLTDTLPKQETDQ